MLHCRFGAVGTLREALLDGDSCDVLIATDAMVAELQSRGRLAAQAVEARAPVGRVRTGMAVKSGAHKRAIDPPDALKTSLLAASAVYFPDPQRATAGIHFARVLDRLGIHDALSSRLRTFPSGAVSMRELATHGPDGAVGCTQITEINDTSGIELAGALPAEFELTTMYTAGLAANAVQPELARRFIRLLAGSTTRELRAQGGFELDGGDTARR